MGSPRKLAEGSKTFSATGFDVAAGSTDCTAGPMRSFALQAKKTGSVTAWILTLEGTIDGVNWDTLLTHTETAPGDGKLIWVKDKPATKLRMSLSVLTGAGTLAAKYIGLPA